MKDYYTTKLSLSHFHISRGWENVLFELGGGEGGGGGERQSLLRSEKSESPEAEDPSPK